MSAIAVRAPPPHPRRSAAMGEPGTGEKGSEQVLINVHEVAGVLAGEEAAHKQHCQAGGDFLSGGGEDAAVDAARASHAAMEGVMSCPSVAAAADEWFAYARVTANASPLSVRTLRRRERVHASATSAPPPGTAAAVAATAPPPPSPPSRPPPQPTLPQSTPAASSSQPTTNSDGASTDCGTFTWATTACACVESTSRRAAHGRDPAQRSSSRRLSGRWSSRSAHFGRTHATPRSGAAPAGALPAAPPTADAAAVPTGSAAATAG